MPKKITILGPQTQALKALFDDENGAHLTLLHVLAVAVLSGEKIDPDFQMIVNAIIAQSVILGKLPPKKKGRPENLEGVSAREVAIQYYLLRDNGVSYSDAVVKIAAMFHKDERHTMRLVKEGKTHIGSTIEARARHREWLKMCAEIKQSSDATDQESYIEYLLRIHTEAHKKVSSRDPIDELDELIDKTLDRIGIADKKLVSFNDSD